MIAPLLLAAALAAASPAGAAGKNTCYNLGGGDSRYYPINDRTILVSAGIRAYRIITAPSPALAQPSSNLQVRGDSVSGRSVVCSPLDIQLFVTGPGVGRTGLIIQSIEPLSRAQADELRKGQPKRSFLRNGA